MKTRWKILIGLTVTLAVTLLVSIVHHFQLKFAVERYKAELKAKGEPMELAHLIFPPVIQELNAAEFFTNAFSALSTNQGVLSTNQPAVMKMISPGKAFAGWQQPFIKDFYGEQASNSWAEIDAALLDEARGLNLLRQLPAQPVFDFQLNYQGGFTKMKFSSLTSAKKAVMKLEASASANLRRGDTEMAGKDIRTMLAIVHGLTHDQILISELVRIALLHIASATTWDFLQSTNTTEAQLEALQRAWQPIEIIRPFERAILVERSVGAIDLKAMRANGLESFIAPLHELGLVDRETGLMADLKIKYKSFMWRWWWSYADELLLLRGEQAALDALRQLQSNQSYQSANLELEKQISILRIAPDSDDSFWFGDPAKADFHFILSSSVPIFAHALNKAAKTEAALQITICAIALKRYQLKHGSLPLDLNALVPDYLPTILPDPMNGKTIYYRRNVAGDFALYSVGENGEDDGGNSSLVEDANPKNLQWQNSKALDWVWPQPATDAEIDFFHEHPPK